MKKLLLISSIVISCKCQSQQYDSLIHSLLQNISALQVKADDEFYAGMFPSFRECGGYPHNYQPDNNIYYTASAAFVLQNLLPQLSNNNRQIADSVIGHIQKVYPYYQNKNGYPYYGFWPTHSIIMPHTYVFQYMKGVFGQGEDADDSVIIMITNNSDDSTSQVLKSRMEYVSNLSQKKIISTYRKYRNIPAYSTWIGSKMTPDFDFAVQCNILYFVLDKHLQWNQQDSATLNLLTQMIKNREYMNAPVFLSPYYVKSSLLIYHAARLMNAFSLPQLNVYKQQLLSDAMHLYNKSSNVMERIILSTAIIRLGGKPPADDVQTVQDFEKSNQQQFVYFQARAAFSYPTFFKQIFLHWSYIYYYFYCPAFYKILWLENLVLKNNLAEKQF